jgi:valyl-tRNA synthetase
MISEYPEYCEKENFEQAEKNIERLKEIIVGIRNTRSELNVPNSKKADLIFVTNEHKNLIENSLEFLKKLGYSENIIIQENKDGILENAVSVIVDGIELYMPLENLVDMEKEKQRKQEEKKKIKAEIERASKMLSNPGFVNKAPANKIQEEREKLEKYKEMLKKFEE